MESPTKSGKLSYSRKVADIVKNIHHSFQKDYNNSFFANFPFSHPLKMSGYLYSSKVLRGHRSRTLALNRLNIGSEHTRWKGVITEKVEEGRKRFLFLCYVFSGYISSSVPCSYDYACTDHSLLIAKLHAYKFEILSLSCPYSYLTDCKRWTDWYWFMDW